MSNLTAHYKDLSKHPAWLDIVEKEEKKINRLKEKYWEDENIEDHKLMEARRIIQAKQNVIDSLKMRIETESAKEQKHEKIDYSYKR